MGETLQASPLSNQSIAQYAELIGSHHGIYSQVGKADLEKLLQLLGGRIQQSQEMFGPEALTVHEPGNFEVHLPPLTSDRRDRFTVAHELGHYFLHYLYPKMEGRMTFGRGTRNRAETQANFFAASLLMPEAQFRTACTTFGSDWWSVGEVFGVSPSAASVRAQVLGVS